MFNHKQLFGYASILFGIGFVIRSFEPAYAYNGPSVSLETNPVKSWGGVVNSDGWQTIDTFSSDFVVTDFAISGWDCNIRIATQNSNSGNNLLAAAVVDFHSPYTHMGPFIANLNSGLKIEAGETLYAYINRSNTCYYTISGHYVHTP